MDPNGQELRVTYEYEYEERSRLILLLLDRARLVRVIVCARTNNGITVVPIQPDVSAAPSPHHIKTDHPGPSGIDGFPWFPHLQLNCIYPFDLQPPYRFTLLQVSSSILPRM